MVTADAKLPYVPELSPRMRPIDNSGLHPAMGAGTYVRVSEYDEAMSPIIPVRRVKKSAKFGYREDFGCEC
jgi:hypothetical protein